MVRDVTVLVPAAGVGSRFEASGYDIPKPLISFEYQGLYTTMMAHSVRHCTANDWPVRYACRAEDSNAFNLRAPSSWQQQIIERSAGQGHTIEQMVEGLQGSVLVVNSDAAIHLPWQVWGEGYAEVEAAVVERPQLARSPYSHLSVKHFPRFDGVVEKLGLSPWACAGAWFFRCAQSLHASLVQARTGPRWQWDELYLSDAMRSVDGHAFLLSDNQYRSWNTWDALKTDPQVARIERGI